VDLRRRLARLDKLSRKPAAAADPAAPAPAEDPERVLRSALGLVREDSAAGTLWVRQESVAGDVCPAGALPDLAGIVPIPAPRALAWNDVLLLDLETTGLMGGTGTLAFLVGLAWWQDGALVVRQLFLAAPGREAPLLADVAARAAGKRAVVTYNGASFDLPLLRTRARLARQQDPCGHLHGLDLLAAARRLWGRRLADCRQQTVESLLRGQARGPGDIAGALIPAAYRAFLRDGRAGLLPEVLRHNRRDLGGLAEILIAVAGAAGDLAAGRAPSGLGEHWAEAWSLALVCERRRETAAAAAWAERMVATAGGGLPLAARRDAVRLLKRVRAWPLVAKLLEEGLAADPDDRHLLYEAAVLYEHRLGDPALALPHARRLGEPGRLERLEARLGCGSTGDAPRTGGCPPRGPAL